MFGDRPANTGSNNNQGNNSLVSTGYTLAMPGGDNLRATMKNALTIDPKNISEENAEKWAGHAGDMKAQLAIFKRESKARLDAANLALQMRGAAYNHLNGAAGIEVRWRQQEARNQQALSEKMMDLRITDAQHNAYSSNIKAAQTMINFK